MPDRTGTGVPISARPSQAIGHILVCDHQDLNRLLLAWQAGTFELVVSPALLD